MDPTQIVLAVLTAIVAAIIAVLNGFWNRGGEELFLRLKGRLEGKEDKDRNTGSEEVKSLSNPATGQAAQLTPPPAAPSSTVPTPRRRTFLPLEEIPKPADLPGGSRMTLRPNLSFVGREDALRKLAQALVEGSVAVTTGIGGIGKTQLATEFVHRYGQFFEGGVFWLSFASRDAIPTEVASCGGADAMKMREDFGALPLDEQVKWVRAAWQEPTRRLLVFDNCEDEALLAQWQPVTGGCKILLTARLPKWSSTLGIRTLPLEGLSRPQSIELLQKYRRYPAEERAHLDAIANELGDLPLALHLAGSFLKEYINHPQLGSPAAYLEKLRSPSLLEHPSMQGEEADASPTKHVQNVGRTFMVSYERLVAPNATDALALRLLAHAAFFAPGVSIPRGLLVATLELLEDDEAELHAEKALKRLVAYGLLKEEADGALVLHRLISAFARGVTKEVKAQEDVERVLSQEAWKIYKAGFPSLLFAWQTHLRFVTDIAQEREDKQAANLCTLLDCHLARIGDYRGARIYSERALAIREKVLGPEHPDMAWSLNNLALLLRRQSDYAAAHSLYERALAIREKVLGAEHPDTATSLDNLAELLRAQGDYEAARPLYERALAVREKMLGAEHPSTARSLNNLAELLRTQGDYEAARPLCERALAIREKTLGAKHPSTASSLNNLAMLHYAQSDYRAARPLLERALAISEKVLGPEHPDTAHSLNNLAMLLEAQGDYAAARPSYERALAICEKVLGPEHPNTKDIQSNLDGLLGKMDR